MGTWAEHPIWPPELPVRNNGDERPLTQTCTALYKNIYLRPAPVTVRQEFEENRDNDETVRNYSQKFYDSGGSGHPVSIEKYRGR